MPMTGEMVGVLIEETALKNKVQFKKKKEKKKGRGREWGKHTHKTTVFSTISGDPGVDQVSEIFQFYQFVAPRIRMLSVEGNRCGA